MPYLFEGNSIEREPLLLFDTVDTSATAVTPVDGLSSFGPYIKDMPAIRTIALAPENRLQALLEFIENLKAGIPSFAGGMERFFKTYLEVVDAIPVLSENDPESYVHAARQVRHRHEPQDVDIVIACVPKWGRYHVDAPYNRLKTFFAAYGFSTQMVSGETISSPRWRALGLGLKIFCKAGGIPWVLRDQFVGTDMVIGISMSHVISEEERRGTHIRHIGYVNVFDKSGRWMFFDGFGASIRMEERHEKLDALLRDAVGKFEAEKNRIPQAIQVHYFKRFSRAEKQIIVSALQRYAPGASVALVSIDDSHSLRFYDTRTRDGSFPRGAYVYLSEKELILSTTGDNPMSRQIGTPVLLKIYSEQYPPEFLSQDDLASQVLGLTKLNWRSTRPFSRKPVSLLFSKRIAYLTSIMSEVTWHELIAAVADVSLRGKPWFL